MPSTVDSCRPVRAARALLLVVVPILAVLILASCGGSDESSTDDAVADAGAGSTSENLEVGERQPPPDPTATRVPREAAELVAEEPDPEPVAPADLFVERGIYAAGVLTEQLSDRPVEIWYPVQSISIQGQDTEVFDALSSFPEQMQALIPQELQGEYDTLSYRDADPADDTFPVLIYGHGFGGFRQVATDYTSHLATWGYIAVSADHLERGLAEQSLDVIGAGLFDETNTRENAAVEDVQATLDLLADINADESHPLFGRINLDQVAISGHSAGAWAAVQAAVAEPERIDTWISIAGGAVDTPPQQPGVVVIGELDAVVEPGRSYELFGSVVSRTVLVNIDDAGHNSFTDSCEGIRDLGGLGVLVDLLGEAQVARADDGCTEDFVHPRAVQDLLNHLTVAHLRVEFDQPVTADSLTREVLVGISPVVDYQIGPTR